MISAAGLLTSAPAASLPDSPFRQLDKRQRATYTAHNSSICAFRLALLAGNANVLCATFHVCGFSLGSRAAAGRSCLAAQTSHTESTNSSYATPAGRPAPAPSAPPQGLLTMGCRQTISRLLSGYPTGYQWAVNSPLSDPWLSDVYQDWPIKIDLSG